jgi:hypothetical protein
MTPAFSPEQVLVLGQALDQLVEKYGPFSGEEKASLAERLLRLMGEEGVSEVDRLVEMVRPLKRGT